MKTSRILPESCVSCDMYPTIWVSSLLGDGTFEELCLLWHVPHRLGELPAGGWVHLKNFKGWDELSLCG